jgi:hypothetical protein
MRPWTQVAPWSISWWSASGPQPKLCCRPRGEGRASARAELSASPALPLYGSLSTGAACPRRIWTTASLGWTTRHLDAGPHLARALGGGRRKGTRKRPDHGRFRSTATGIRTSCARSRTSSDAMRDDGWNWPITRAFRYRDSVGCNRLESARIGRPLAHNWRAEVESGHGRNSTGGAATPRGTAHQESAR